MKMGIGVSQFLYWQSDDKTSNLFDLKLISQPNRTNPAVTWNSDGWPTFLPAGVNSGWYLPGTEGYVKPGRYRLAAKGSGQLYFNDPDIPKDKQVATVKAATPGATTVIGEYDLSTTGRMLTAIMATDPADPLRDVRLYRANLDPAQTFTPEYLAELKNFRVIRFAGWPSVINSPEVDWPSNPNDPAGSVAKWRAAIELCNILGCDAWINIPHKASDGYVTELGKLFAASLKPGIKVYIEYSIEVWNWGPPFGYATKWVGDWTAANLGPTYAMQHGHAFLANHVQSVFAAAAPGIEIVRMISNQHFNPENFRQNLEMIDSRHMTFDAVTTAPYADPAQYLDWTVLDPLVADGTAASRDAAIGLIFDAYRKTIPALDQYAAQYKALADKHGMKMFAYECGPGWQLPSPPPTARSALFLDSYRDPRMRAFLSDVYFPWMAKYYTLAMYTQHTDRPTPDKFWGVRGTADETPAPKLDACLAWCRTYNPDTPPPPAPPPTPQPAYFYKEVRMKALSTTPLAYSLVRGGQVRNFRTRQWEAATAAPTADQFLPLTPAGPGLFAGIQNASIQTDGVDFADDARTFGSFRFVGTDCHFAADPTLCLSPSKVFTWACWYKSKGAAVPNATMVGEGSNSSDKPLFQLRCDETTGTHGGIAIRDNAGALATVVGAKVIGDGNWHHLAATCDGTTLALYVDGAADGTTTVAALGVITVNRLCFGGLFRAALACQLPGDLDDVRCYPRALTASDVAAVSARWLNGPSGAADVDVATWATTDGTPTALVGLTPLSSYAPAKVTTGGGGA